MPSAKYYMPDSILRALHLITLFMTALTKSAVVSPISQKSGSDRSKLPDVTKLAGSSVDLGFMILNHYGKHIA